MPGIGTAAGLGAVVLASVLAITSCGGGGPSTSNGYAVPAVREPLANDSTSPVAHDNEVMALATQAGRLFAATDQWEYQGPSAYGQVLVKDSGSSPWRVFEQTQSSRVQALDSFPIPADQGLGPGHSLLITQAIVDGRSRIQWLLDGAKSFTPADSYVLPSTADAVRSFGAHESERGVVGLRGRQPDRGSPRHLVPDEAHPGVRRPPRTGGGTPRIARPEDPEGHRLRRLAAAPCTSRSTPSCTAATTARFPPALPAGCSCTRSHRSARSTAGCAA